MRKIKIRNTTRTVWSQITKQTDFELNNGIKVSVRQGFINTSIYQRWENYNLI